jgi:hypothetical protein
MHRDNYGHLLMDNSRGVCQSCHHIDMMLALPDAASRKAYLATLPIVVLMDMFLNHRLTEPERNLVKEAWLDERERLRSKLEEGNT